MAASTGPKFDEVQAADEHIGSFQDYKAKLLELITSGNSLGVQRLLKFAPHSDYNKFRFKMVNKSGEEIFVSAISLAVNVGDYQMLDSILTHMKNINIDEGIEAKPIDQSDNLILKIRRTSPLQFACNLGLYKVVDRLLKEGANPNGNVASANQS